MSNLVIYTGPMKSGKTTALLEKYNLLKNATKLKLKLFKPTIDNRFSDTAVVSRDNISIECTNLNSLEELSTYIPEYDVIFIDEFQFLTGDINVILDAYLNHNKSFYISGLNLTTERKPFGKLPDLMPYASNIQMLKGNCDVCGDILQGRFSYYQGTKTTDVLVGENNYLCVCSDCYNTLSKHN